MGAKGQDMQVTIRSANPDDADQLVAIIRESLGDEVDQDRIATILESGRHTSLVAIIDGRGVGFVDGFVTEDSAGVVRSELDLLGVLPAMQGMGIGRRLVGQFVDDIRSDQSCAYIRALVAVDNHSMHRVMREKSFHLDDKHLGLFIKPLEHVEGSGETEGHLIPVDTLTYSGVWIEDCFGHTSIRAANQFGLQSAKEIVGVLISLQDVPALKLAEQHGFEQIGGFQWWRLELPG